MDKNYTVYMHTNKINKKVYVGITCQEPKKRWKNGLGYLDNEKTKFARAIAKYGWDGFEHIIFAENVTHDEACHMEQLLIVLYDTINNGYNITKGGDGVCGFHHTEEAKQKNREAHIGKKHTKEAKQKMSKSRTGEKHFRATKIMQYDKEMNLIKIWDCIMDIERELGINHRHISDVCKGKPKRKTCGGFIWRYYDEEKMEVA